VSAQDAFETALDHFIDAVRKARDKRPGLADEKLLAAVFGELDDSGLNRNKAVGLLAMAVIRLAKEERDELSTSADHD
jgi:hypothetical protein